MSNSLHLPLKYRQVIEKMVLRFIPDVEVWAYGSRVTGKNHDGSDLDLILRGPNLEKIDAFQLQDFTEAIKESTIPILVEARDWARVPKRFHKEINDNHYVLYRPDHFNNITTFGDCAMLVKNVVQPNINTNDLFVGLEHIEKHTLVLSGHGFAKDVSSQKYRFLKGDILFGKLNPYFRKVVRVRFDGICSTDIWVVRPQKGVDSKFLFYLMASMEFIQWVSKGSEGTSLPRAKWDYVSRFKLNLPPTHSQRKIACILSTLDDKIELNRRMNKTLESIALAVFKDWFINFGPTCAKVEGRSSYLASNIWNQFPNTLDIEDKPTAWLVYALSDLALQHRATLSPNAHPNRIYEHYSIPAYDAGYEPVADLGGSIKSNKIIVPSGAVLLSKINPEMERIWLPQTSKGVPQIASTEFLALRPLAPATRSVLYFLFKNQDFQAKMTAFSTGTSKSHQRVHVKSLFSCKVLTASPTLLALFDEMMDPIINRLLSNRRETRWLIQTRDILLPKLMSRELQIKATEKIIEKKHNLRVDGSGQNVVLS